MMTVSEIALLCCVATATSAISAIVGLGGGVTLLAVMAVMLPPPLVVPLHGVVQLVSNGTRAGLLAPHVHRRIFALYIVPASVGVLLGARFYVGSPLPWFRPAVGLFLLLFVASSFRRPRFGQLPVGIFVPLGFVTGMVASLIGATGPLIAPFFLRDDLDKEEFVATQAAVQIVTHAAKIPAFFALGFAYGPHLTLLLPLCAAAVLGTALGRRALRSIPVAVFRRAVLAALFFLGCYLIASGLA